jgi:hypothetical protein
MHMRPCQHDEYEYAYGVSIATMPNMHTWLYGDACPRCYRNVFNMQMYSGF